MGRRCRSWDGFGDRSRALCPAGPHSKEFGSCPSQRCWRLPSITRGRARAAGHRRLLESRRTPVQGHGAVCSRSSRRPSFREEGRPCRAIFRPMAAESISSPGQSFYEVVLKYRQHSGAGLIRLDDLQRHEARMGPHFSATRGSIHEIPERAGIVFHRPRHPGGLRR